MEWLGLNNLFFLLIIPIILLLYILKRKHEDMVISSTLLWNRMLRDLDANRPWQRLRRNLLLALQLLVASLLIIALLKPVIPTNGAIADHTVIVIDSSGSMLAKEAGGLTRFEIAKLQVADVIENLGTGQRITLIEMGATPRIVASNTSNKSTLMEALEHVQPRPGIGDDLTAFSLGKSIAQTESNSGIMWFGDGANYKLLNQIELLPEGLVFEHIQSGSIRENISIGTFVTEQNGSISNGIIRVDNRGLLQKDVSLSIYNVDGILLDSFSFQINGGGTKTLELTELPFSSAYQGVLDVNEDGLEEDNQLWSIPFTKGNISALIVSPEGNHFLNQALKATKRIELEQTDTVSPLFTQQANFYIFDGVIPDNLPDGNSLIIAPNKSTNWFKLLEEVELTNTLENTKTHPLLSYVNVKDIYVAKANKLEIISGLEVLAKSGNIPIILAGEINHRRVVIMTFDLQQSDFPLRSDFPIFIQNVIEWLAPMESLPIGSASPGERLTIPFTTGIDKKFIYTPNNHEIAIDGTGTIYSYEVPEEIGLYRVEEYKSENHTTRYFSIQMDEAETKISPKKIVLATATSNETIDIKRDFVTGFKDLASWFILIALLFSFLEWVVYQRGY